jgi:hypothetical protein
MTERTRVIFAAPTGTPPSFIRKGKAWAEVTELSDGSFRVRFGGLLSPTWMLGVCSGLAQAQISIDRLHARRLSHDSSWIAELHVLPLASATSPTRLPLLTFAEQGTQVWSDVHENPETRETSGFVSAVVGAGQPVPLRLRRYELTHSTDHGGTLCLELTAQDSVGLLGSLLCALGNLSLWPVEMHIETREGEAYDCLWLATGSAREPSVINVPAPADQLALHDLLSRAIEH